MTRTTDLQSDLRADLLNDLASPAPLPSSLASSLTSPTMAAEPVAPAFGVTLTPLSWSRPSVRAGRYGSGMTVKVGPWRLEIVL